MPPYEFSRSSVCNPDRERASTVVIIELNELAHHVDRMRPPFAGCVPVGTGMVPAAGRAPEGLRDARVVPLRCLLPLSHRPICREYAYATESTKEAMMRGDKDV